MPIFKKIFDKKLFIYDDSNNKILIKPIINKKKKGLRVGIIIDTALSIPPTTGVTYRLYYLSLTLSDLGYEQNWFICNRNFQDVDSLNCLKNKKIKIHLLPPHLFYDVDFMNTLLKKEKIEILQYEIIQTFISLGIALKKLNNIPVLLENHDVEANLRESLCIKKEVSLMKFLQFTACNFADSIISMTSLDKQTLENMGVNKEKMFLAPNGINSDFIYNGINKKDNILLYLGNIFYPPNKQGLEFLIKKVLPILKRKKKNVKIKIIGMTPDSLIQKYSNRADIIFAGEIKNTNLFNNELATGLIGLCTVFSGSGMKVKILNYCASGLPVIATHIGLSGYEQIESIIKVNTEADEIADAIIKLLDNKKLAENLGKKNRQAILQNFNWNSIAKKVIKAYQFAYNTNVSKTVEEITPPKPFWFMENRDCKKVLDDYFLIDKDKIINKK